MLDDYNDVESFLEPDNKKLNIKQEDVIEDTLKEYNVGDELLEDNEISIEEFLDYVKNNAKQDVYSLVKKMRENSSEKEKIIAEKKETDEKKDIDDINLFTKSVKSLITGEQIDLDNLSPFEKIGELYYQTRISLKKFYIRR